MCISYFIEFNSAFIQKDTYIGFYFGWCMQVPIVSTYTLWFCMKIVLFVELCFYVDALACDFQSFILDLNTEVIGDIRTKSSPKTIHHDQKIDVILKEVIELHNDMLKYDMHSSSMSNLLED